MTTEYRPLLTAAEALAVLDREIARNDGQAYRTDEAHNRLLTARALFATQAAEIEALRIDCANWNRIAGEQEAAIHEATARAEAAEARAARLADFARDILDPDRRYSIDGADVESLAEKHGLLAGRIVNEACGEECVCAEVGFPQSCLRWTDTLRKPDAALGPGGGA